jgi:hypothetical protein
MRGLIVYDESAPWEVDYVLNDVLYDLRHWDVAFADGSNVTVSGGAVVVVLVVVVGAVFVV